jgi:hypothetical protein
LKLEVMINQEPNPNYKGLASNYKMAKDATTSGKKDVINIEQCFREYGAEELLNGSDQWYCSKC